MSITNKAFKTLLGTLLVFALLLPFGTQLNAQERQPEECLTQIRTAYWDIWKHEAGHWQYSGKPGDTNITHTYPVAMPEKFKEGYTDIRAEIKQGPVTVVRY